MESDYECAIKAFYQDHELSLMESVILDLKLMSRSFSFSLSFIPRSCNGVAHHMAKNDCDYGLNFLCVASPSDDLSLVDVDLHSFHSTM